MNKEQFIQLCKTLGLPEDSTVEVVTAKLTEMKTKLEEKGGDDFKAIAQQLTDAIKLIKVDNKPQGEDDAVTKLTAKIDSLFAKFDEKAIDETTAVFERAVIDRKVLPSQKEVLVGTKEKPGTFFKNAAGLKSFVDTLPALKLTAEVVIPKKEDGKPLTYNELLKDPKKYAELHESNPALLDELRAKRFEA